MKGRSGLAQVLVVWTGKATAEDVRGDVCWGRLSEQIRPNTAKLQRDMLFMQQRQLERHSQGSIWCMASCILAVSGNCGHICN